MYTEYFQPQEYLYDYNDDNRFLGFGLGFPGIGFGGFGYGFPFRYGFRRFRRFPFGYGYRRWGWGFPYRRWYW